MVSLGRIRQDSRLRAGQAGRPRRAAIERRHGRARGHAAGRGDGDRRLHVAGAGERPGGGRPIGSVFARRSCSTKCSPAAVRSREPTVRGHDVGHPARRSAGARRSKRRRCPRRSAGSSNGAWPKRPTNATARPAISRGIWRSRTIGSGADHGRRRPHRPAGAGRGAKRSPGLLAALLGLTALGLLARQFRRSAGGSVATRPLRRCRPRRAADSSWMWAPHRSRSRPMGGTWPSPPWSTARANSVSARWIRWMSRPLPGTESARGPFWSPDSLTPRLFPATSEARVDRGRRRRDDLRCRLRRWCDLEPRRGHRVCAVGGQRSLSSRSGRRRGHAGDDTRPGARRGGACVPGVPARWPPFRLRGAGAGQSRASTRHRSIVRSQLLLPDASKPASASPIVSSSSRGRNLMAQRIRSVRASSRSATRCRSRRASP